MNNRNPFWDVAKGIAVLLVLFGHSIQSGSGACYTQTNAFFDNPFYLFIYSFHMPLFMLISGYLFASSLKKYTFKTIFAKRSQSLLIPILVFGSVWFLWVCRGKYTLLNYLDTLSHTLWFLQAVFISSVITALIWRLSPLQFRWWIAILVSLSGLFFPDYGELAGVKFLYPCFLVGIGLARFWESGFWVKYKLGFFIFFSVAFLILLLSFNKDFLFYRTGVYLFSGIQEWNHLLYIDVYRDLIGVFGCLAVLSGLRLIPEDIIQKCRITQVMGKESKGLYCFQTYLFAIYASISGTWAKPGILFWLLGIASVGITSYCLTIIAKRVPFLKI
ncbi:MAG: acyltransferase family protein [Bacteroidales bacterium]|nr:acyltransferase family protein [Bacteroidales bacterium]